MLNTAANIKDNTPYINILDYRVGWFQSQWRSADRVFLLSKRC